METIEIKKLIERVEQVRAVKFKPVKDGNFFDVECNNIKYLNEDQAKDLAEALNDALTPYKVAVEKEIKKKLAVFV